MKRMLVALLLVTVNACAPTVVWLKPGATQQDFARDSYQCEKDMRQSGYFGGGLVGALNAQDFQNRCMVAQGWTLTRQQFGSPYYTPPTGTEVKCQFPKLSAPITRDSPSSCTAAGGAVVN